MGNAGEAGEVWDLERKARRKEQNTVDDINPALPIVRNIP